MGTTRTGAICLGAIIAVSVTLAAISNMMDADEGRRPLASAGSRDRWEGDAIVVGDSPGRLFHFIQISDIHISSYHDRERITDLEEFCDVTVSVIKPSVVLATGDLTDGKLEDNIGSAQIVDEWKSYRRVLDNCKPLKTNETLWMDIRGNHDNFDVPGADSQLNYYNRYSASRQSKSSIRLIDARNYAGRRSEREIYALIGVDACTGQGLKRPFNFVGVIDGTEVDRLDEMARQAAAKADYALWYGHYPTSCILAKGSKVRQVIAQGDKSLAYLSGHLHRIVPDMYTIHKQGYLELELADWKKHRYYRVGAIDHGLLSFADVTHRDWPVVLITNPKNALFAAPSREPLHRMATSTHIRILVFSPETILGVDARIDDGGAWTPCRRATTKNGELPPVPLYVVDWDPKLYARGLHYVRARIVTGDGKERIFEQPFSLDGTTLGFKVLPRLALMTNLTTVFQVLFGVAILGCTVPLCILRYVNTRIRLKKLGVPVIKPNWALSWLKSLCAVASFDRFFYPLTVYPLYLAVGPWSVGELIDGHVGILFVWGTFINSTYLPGSSTYAYGFVELFLFQTPLVLALSCKLHSRMYDGGVAAGLCGDLLMAVSVLVQVGAAVLFWLAYGAMATLVAPLRLAPLAIIVALWRLANTLPAPNIRQALIGWPRSGELRNE